MGTTTLLRRPQTAFSGDVVGTTIPTVYWPEDAFEHTDPVRIPNAATFDTALTGTADPTIGPYDATSADTVQVRTRYLMWVPPSLAPLLLAAPLPPKEAYTTLHNEMTTAGIQADCGPVLKQRHVQKHPNNTMGQSST